MSSRSNRTKRCVSCGKNFSRPSKEKLHDMCIPCFSLWKVTRKKKA